MPTSMLCTLQCQQPTNIEMLPCLKVQQTLNHTGWLKCYITLFSVGLLLYHDKNTSSNPHFLLLLYIQNIPVKSIQLGWNS